MYFIAWWLEWVGYSLILFYLFIHFHKYVLPICFLPSPFFISRSTDRNAIDFIPQHLSSNLPASAYWMLALHLHMKGFMSSYEDFLEFMG